MVWTAHGTARASATCVRSAIFRRRFSHWPKTATVYYAAGSAAELTHAVGAIIMERAPVSFGAEAQVHAAQHHDRNAGTHGRRLCCCLRKHRRHRRTKLQRAAARQRRGEAGW